MDLLPCPHARFNSTLCPHCNGLNDLAYQQLEIEEPQYSYEIVEDGEASTTTEITIIDIA